MILSKNLAVYWRILVSALDFCHHLLFAANVHDLINSKGLDAHQTAFAIKKYKSHRRVGLTSEIVALMQASDWC